MQTFASSQQGWAIGCVAQYLQSGQYSQDGSTVLWQTNDGGKTWKKVNYII